MNWTARILLALALVCFAGAAFAQDMQCGQRNSIVAGLAKEYNEHPVGRGIVGEAQITELFASADGATWTLLVSNPQGVSCIVASGKGWETLEPPLPGQGT